MNAVIICIIVCVCSMEGTNAWRSWKYFNENTLNAAVKRICCNSGKRTLSIFTDDFDGQRSMITKPDTDLPLSVREDDDEKNTPNDIPSVSRIRAKSFIFHRITVRGMYEECCLKTCNNEETREGTPTDPIELGEECINEGCEDEEIREHC